MSGLWQDYRNQLSGPVLGFVSSFVLFFLGYVPFRIAGPLAGLFLVFPLLYVWFKRRREPGVSVSFLRDVVRSYSYVGTIMNPQGDFHSIERKKFTLRRPKPLDLLPQHLIMSPSANIHVEPPRLLTSQPQQRNLIRRYYKDYFDHVSLPNGSTQKYHCVEYAYCLSVPLRHKDDFVEYEVQTVITGHLSGAFTESGEVDGCTVTSLDDMVTMVMKAPPKHRIEIMDFWVQDEQGNKVPRLCSLMDSTPPVLEANETQWKWILEYPALFHLYLVKFRVVPFGA